MDSSEASTSPPPTDPVPDTQDPPIFKVYRPPASAASVSTGKDVPETYFEPTKADIKLAQDSLHSRTESLVNAPFRTREMREAAEKLKEQKYPTTRIRIKFSDRTQLEKTFPSSDKIKSVYAFVRGLLREDVKPVKFVLYQTPPPRELKVSDPKVKDCTLLQLQLVPTAALYLKFLDEALNHNDVPAPLDSAVLALAEDLPIPPSLDEHADNSTAPKSGGNGGQTLSSSSGPSESSSTGKGKGTLSGEAQKKLGKFFKNLGPSKFVPFSPFRNADSSKLET